MGSTSVVRSSEGLLVTKVGSEVDVSSVEESDTWRECDEGGTKGTRKRVTSVRSRTFVPLPGINTRVAPLLVEEEPTAMPNSALGAYFQVRSVGGIAATGQPNGNRKLVEISGGFPSRSRERREVSSATHWYAVCSWRSGSTILLRSPTTWLQETADRGVNS